MDNLLKWVSVIASLGSMTGFVFSLFVAVKIYKMKEELRAEIKSSVEEVREGLASKEQLKLLTVKLKWMFITIARQLKISTKDFEDEEE